MNCSAVLTTNVAVLDVTQPTANQKWAPRCNVHRFYRKSWRGMHAWCLHRCRHPVASQVQMAALGATICNTFKRVGGSVTSVSKPCGLDDCCQATERDCGGYPKTVTNVKLHTTNTPSHTDQRLLKKKQARRQYCIRKQYIQTMTTTTSQKDWKVF